MPQMLLHLLNNIGFLPSYDSVFYALFIIFPFRFPFTPFNTQALKNIPKLPSRTSRNVPSQTSRFYSKYVRISIAQSHLRTWDTRLALYAASCLRYSFFAVSVFFLYTCHDKTNKQRKNILRGQSCSSCSCAQLFLEMGSNGSPFMSHNA